MLLSDKNGPGFFKTTFDGNRADFLLSRYAQYSVQEVQ